MTRQRPWWLRWWPLWGRDVPPPRPEERQDGASLPAAAPTARPAAGADAEIAFGQRRPLLGRSGEVSAFELRLGGGLSRRLALRDASGASETAAAAHFGVLLTAASELLRASRQVLVELPAPLLSRPALQALAAPGLMVLPVSLHGFPTTPWPAAAAQAWQRRGATVGVPDGPPDQAPAADFVVLRATAGGLDTLRLSLQRWHEHRPHLPLVALGLSGVDECERTLRAGAHFVGGSLDAAVSDAVVRPVQAAAHQICRLLNDLALDRELGVIAEAVRSDVTLSYRLLRYANSAAIGLQRGVESVEHAVMVLGRAELARWLSVMLLSAAEGRQASAALREEALARGWLLEQLARGRGHTQAQALFTVGLLSRLHLLLQAPLPVVLEPLRLGEEARSALLHRRGPWAPYLALADALEGDDETLLAERSAPFGGVQQVSSQAAQAWALAAAMTART